MWVSVNLTSKVFYGWIKDLKVQFSPIGANNIGWNPLKWISMHASNKEKDRDRIYFSNESQCMYLKKRKIEIEYIF